jgi:hypothetical protein
MEEQLYEKMVMRHASSWNAPAVATQAAEPDKPVPPALASEPTGKPTTIDYPTAASIPPINIMTPEPATGTAAAPPASSSAAAQAAPKPRQQHPAAKKPPAPKPHAPPPVSLTPPAAPSAQN